MIPISKRKWIQPYNLHWDAKTNSLYFVDFISEDSAVNRFDFYSNRIYSAPVEGNEAPTFLIPIKKHKNQFIVSDQRAVEIIEWNGKHRNATPIKQIFAVEQSDKYANNIWNVAKVSPKCKFFVGGTFRGDVCAKTTSANGALYRYSKSKKVKKLLRNIPASSGIDWNVHENKFYHTDSCAGVIREYDWNPKTGGICKCLR